MRVLFTVAAAAAAAAASAQVGAADIDETSCHQPVDDPLRTDLRPIRAVDVAADCPPPTVLGRQRVHMLEFTPAPDVFLVLRNGESHGFKVHYARANECLRTLARFAVDVPGPKFMYTSAGLPLRDIGDAAANGMVFALSTWETWVWPGVRVNHTMVIDGVKFTTISMKPRAFLLENIFTDTFVDHLVQTYDKSLTRSPEKHYAKGFENHRTSATGWMGPDDAASVFIREKVQRLLRLPYLEYSEVPQFLRYTAGQWYRYHHDYFHSYKRLAATELVEWLRARVLDLAQLGISVAEDDASPVAVAARQCRASVDTSTLRDLFPRVRSSRPILLALLNAHEPLPYAVARDLCAEAGAPASCATVQQLDAFLRRRPPGLDKLRALSAILAQRLADELGVPEAAAVFSVAYDDARLETPALERAVQCNRHATLLPYLNHVAAGGETVLPDAVEPAAFTRDGRFPVREGMTECSRGVVVSPVKGGGALFYHRLGSGALDPLSLHGGCPPEPGSTKYALNCFTWSCNTETGMQWFE